MCGSPVVFCMITINYCFSVGNVYDGDKDFLQLCYLQIRNLMLNVLTRHLPLYLKFILNARRSLCISLLRNVLLSGIAILTFPLLFGDDSLCRVMLMKYLMVSMVFL